jgi:hypothetical protein
VAIRWNFFSPDQVQLCLDQFPRPALIGAVILIEKEIRVLLSQIALNCPIGLFHPYP